MQEGYVQMSWIKINFILFFFKHDLGIRELIQTLLRFFNDNYKGQLDLLLTQFKPEIAGAIAVCLEGY